MDKSTQNPGKEYTVTPVKVKDMKVQDRKTGEWYNPQERFEQLMAQEYFVAVMKRMKDR